MTIGEFITKENECRIKIISFSRSEGCREVYDSGDKLYVVARDGGYIARESGYAKIREAIGRDVLDREITRLAVSPHGYLILEYIND